MQAGDLKIIMIDDSDIDRFIVKRSLQIFGLHCELVEFSSPAKFLEWLDGQSQSANLAIVDLNMPGMDGFQLIEKIRKMSLFKKMPIAVLTSDSNTSTAEKALATGANLYFTKPLKGDAIRQIEILASGVK